MAYDTFISYSSKDKATADAACAVLESAGVRCWIAPRDIKPGADWASSIIEAIDGCRVMVLIFSASANGSKQIRREVQRAFDREVPVVPVRIDNTTPSNTLAYYMGPVHWLDALTPPIEKHLQQLATAVKGFLDASEPPPAPLSEDTALPGMAAPERESVASPIRDPRPSVSSTEPKPASMTARRSPVFAAALAAVALVGVVVVATVAYRQDNTVEQPAPASTTPPRASPAPGGMPTLRMRLTSSFPKAIPTAVEKFAERVAASTGGRFNIQVFAAGEIVPGLQVLDAVQNGTVELGYTAGHYYIGKEPALQFLAGAPFGLEPRQHLAWRQRADVKAAFGRILDHYNVVALPCGAFGRLEDLWLRKAIGTISDLNGLKFRASGWVNLVYAKLKAVPVQVAAGDIYPMLEKGMLDGAQWLTPYHSERLGLSKIALYYYYPGVVMPSMIIDLVVNRQTWDQLPPEYRAIIESACSEAANGMAADEEALSSEALKRLVAGGTRLGSLPLAVQKRLYEASREVETQTAADNEAVRGLVALLASVSRDTVGARLK